MHVVEGAGVGVEGAGCDEAKKLSFPCKCYPWCHRNPQIEQPKDRSDNLLRLQTSVCSAGI